MTTNPSDVSARLAPVGYAIATYFTERREEYERGGTVIYRQPAGMATMPLYGGPDAEELVGRSAVLSEWAERLQTICDAHGALGGVNRLDFIEALLDAKSKLLADLRAALTRIAEASPESINSASAAGALSWTYAVAQTALASDLLAKLPKPPIPTEGNDDV